MTVIYNEFRKDNKGRDCSQTLSFINNFFFQILHWLATLSVTP